MPKKLLLAEDSLTIRKVFELALSRSDIAITAVDNGEDAVRLAGEIFPDLVVADLTLPGKNGFAVAAELRAMEKTGKRSPSSSSPGPWSLSTRRASRPAGREASFSSPSSPGSCWRTSNVSCARVRRPRSPGNRRRRRRSTSDGTSATSWTRSRPRREIRGARAGGAGRAAPRGDPPRRGQDPPRLQRVRCVDRRDRRGRAISPRSPMPPRPCRRSNIWSKTSRWIRRRP